MSTTYRTADPEAFAIMTRLLDTKPHKDLKSYGVKIGLQFAFGTRDDKTGKIKTPPLSVNGYPAIGVARIISHKDRAAGMPDVVVYLDGDEWPEWTDRRREALIAHELWHFEVVDKLDQSFRPVVKMRKHDVQIGVFTSIAQRYGEDAFDTKMLVEAAVVYRQLELPFPDDPATPGPATAAGESAGSPAGPPTGSAVQFTAVELARLPHGPDQATAWRSRSILNLSEHGVSADACSRLADMGVASLGDLDKLNGQIDKAVGKREAATIRRAVEAIKGEG